MSRLIIIVNLLVLIYTAGTNAATKSAKPPNKAACIVRKPVCPKNEELSNCIQGVCRPQSCEQRGPIACAAVVPVICDKGCICKQGYLRDSSGKCIPERKCPVTCGLYEEFTNCTQALCRRFHCSEQDQPVYCPAVEEGSCYSGCVCKAGYLWTEYGDCVPESQCFGDLVCNDKEIVNTCPSSCFNDYCLESEDDNRGCISNKMCGEPVCTCSFNSRRAYNGTCIPTKDCPPFDCSARPNEEYNPCPPICPSDSCSQASHSGKCPFLVRIGIIQECQPSCRCKKGYWRNDGICVPYEKCPGKCPKHEKFSTCIQGECRAHNCTQKDQPVACPTVKKGSCKQGCICEEGYLRDDKGICIPEKKCPVTCGVNEVFSNCTQSLCRHLHCSQQGEPDCATVPAEYCVSGCVCKAGYVWTEDGDCVPESQCYADKCPINEKFSTCIQGECRAQYCIQKSQAIACPVVEKGSCKQGCICEEGYLRDDKGNCVPKDRCPVRCGVDEVFSNCTQSLCRRFHCSQQDASDCPTVPEASCESGCVCKAGYVWTDDGDCVPETQCYGDLVCSDNEMINTCPPSCFNDYCPESEGDDGGCPANNKSDKMCREPVCTCHFNNKRASNGTCIPTVDCPPFDCSARPNEEYNPCPPICPSDNCSQATPSGKCPLPGRIGIVLECKPSCRCKKGYWRDNGVCVPYEKCPGKCPINEKFSTCIQGECRAQNCTQKGHPVACPDVEKGSCKQGCICEEGYLRDDNGNCIPEDKCPVTCGVDEVFSNCTQSLCRRLHCSQQGEPDCATVPAASCESGCVCKAGYVWTEDGDCVPESQCYGDLVCSDHEMINTCPPSCFNDYCPESEGDDGGCPANNKSDKMCREPVCTCHFNNKRASNGTCIPTVDCPPFDCSARPNEEYNSCPPICPSDSCSQASRSGKCPLLGRIGIVLECKPSCRCKKGYWRDNGVCVPYEKCPGKCPINEKFSTCIQGECRAQNCAQKGHPVACPDVEKGSCKQGCICEEGYLRDDNGNCIPEDKCPVTCGVDEVFSNCTQSLCRRLHCSQQGEPDCATVPADSCESGCVCKAGYVGTEDGDCVPESQCYGDLVCSDHEMINTCPPSCFNDYCPESEDDDGGCLANNKSDKMCGEPVCTCHFNNKRASNGTCIPTVDCPPFDCSARPNEEYNPCPPICPSDSCSQASRSGKCPLPGRIGIVLECKPSCRCKKGYWRDNGVCVPYEKCPGKCPINEKFTTCIQGECRAQNCTQKGHPVACPDVEKGSCKQGCICEEGYLRDDNGNCIPEDKCPVTCGVDEVFSNCTQSLCRRLHCSQQGEPDCATVPAASCESGCVCKAGYVWTEDGDCVPESQCYGDLVCSDHEMINTCPPSCFNDYCPESEGDDGGCPANNKSDKMCREPVCTCHFNNKRASNGTCIPTVDCPPFDCSARPNEEYNPCPPICPSDSCSQASRSGKCPLPGRIGIVLECKPSCRCKKGYWRDNGVCVPYEKCPGKCPINEKFSTCIQGECRAQNCTQKGHPVACPDVEKGSCKQGCICEEGYLRDDEGNCIPEDKCPVTCGVDEVFSNCTQSLCRRLHCSQQGEPDCAAVPAASCESGCVCKAGYVWTEDGDCVPESQCYGDLVCSDHEMINTCPSSCFNDYCPESEDDDGGCLANNKSDKMCGEPVCTCHFSNKRASNGTCIPTVDCPPFDCSARPNEEYNPCPPICPSDSCSQASRSGKCPLLVRIGIVLECKPSCRCKKGYWRNDGICVPYEKCPGKCPINEKFSTCIQRDCLAQNCTQKGHPVACPLIKEGSCKQGCICEEGYLRDDTGNCIPEDKCPVKCSDDEVFSNCTQSLCRRLHCSQQGNPADCPTVPKANCKSGCVCKAGYVWTKDGNCIPESQCYGDLVCRDREVVNTCPPTCFNEYCLDSEDDDGGCTSLAQNKMCGDPVCTCPFNYQRAFNGTCIPTRDCPPFDCSTRPNEEYNSCPPICPSDSCSQASRNGKCPIPGRIGIVLKCAPKCHCIEGYWRNNGTCVPYEKCPGKCPLNEEFSNCTQRTCRAQDCLQKGQSTPICPAVKDKSCKTGCICVEGTLRNADGKCVPEDKCPAKKCEENEILNTCTNGCDAIDCPKSFKDEQKKSETCIASDVCGPSECRCKKGYRRLKGKCIPIEECPDLCSANEEFSNCTQAICRELKCNQKGQPLSCTTVEEGSCKSGCVCRSGYLRTSKGKCVPDYQCYGDLVCDQDEIVKTCPNYGFSDYCPDNRFKAKLAAKVLSEPCSGDPECVCRFNYRRATNGTCIPARECPPFKCEEPNEEFNPCPPHCPGEDCSHATPNGDCQLKGRIGIVVECKPNCRCVSGYWRNNGVCVPYAKCPGKCSSNEEFSNCTQRVCRTQDCSQKGEITPTCPSVKDKSCKTGCVCVEGTLRDADGKCVPEDQCPAKKCEENEILKTCTNDCDVIDCPESFNDEQERVKNCVAPAFCGPSECRCKKGYRRLEGKCIPVGECPGICAANEEFSNCTQTLCRELNCSQKGKPILCPTIEEGSCKSGCVCQQGYLRTATGKCVPDSQCYGDLVCKQNEIAKACSNNDLSEFCPANQFEAVLSSTIISEPCSGDPDCTCRFNYKRAENGTCIPAQECPPFKCDQPNEEFHSCPPQCPSEDCSQATPTGDCPLKGRIGIVVECKPNCRCISGYWRLDGICVPYAECPGKCPSNEEFSNCTQRVCRAQGCKQKGEHTPCPATKDKSCKTGCVCIEGTLRDADGKCVPEDKCPVKKCDENEFLNTCTNGCDAINCPKSYKDEQKKLKKCVAPAFCGPTECRCKKGYRRLDGKCIPVGECPGICSANEEFSNCTQAICRELKCSQKGKPFNCPAVEDGSCNSGCVCQAGYLRTARGKCVPDYQCYGDLICEENEIAKACSSNDVSEYCPANKFEAKLSEETISEPCSGDPECSCRFNYKRAENGTCIPAQECPPFECDEPNEEFNACPPYCPGEDCSHATPNGDCLLKGRIGIVVECKPNCRCISGYWRNNGECVPYAECPGKCRTNEEFSNCTQRVCRTQDCSQKGQATICPAVKDKSCNTGCVCVEGTLRDADGKCVPEDKCPAKTCGENEFLNNCTHGCDPINCPRSYKDEKKKFKNCVAPHFCGPSDCRCIKGYRRKNGKCIPIEECPGICPVNEEFSNCTQALCRGQHCKDRGQPIACPSITEGSCKSGCVCKIGMLRDKHGKCVPEEKCPAKTCGKNEFMNICTYACDPVDCPNSYEDEQKYLEECVAPAFCGPDECRCIKGYRRLDGKCIPIGECPGICSVNEEFSSCIQSLCRAQNCTDKGQPIACPAVSNDDCVSGCVCKEGTLRDKYGICVPEDKCPAKKCDKNEFLNTCTNRCDLIDCPNSFEEEKKKSEDCIAPFICGPEECRCKRGYRRQNGKCIPIGECPGICSLNEEFSYCTQAICRALNCTDKELPIACPSISEGDCESGCVCQAGTLRDKYGKCIPEDKCPAKTCGKNEFLNTCTNACDRVNCPKSFEDEQKKLEECVAAAVCGPAECRCKEGYRRQNGKCIPIEECPGICSANEEFSNCTHSLCRAQSCQDQGRPIACPAITEGSCKSGCVCKAGMLRDKNGQCVPENQCPAIGRCAANEVYSKCTQAVCRTQLCRHRGQRVSCPAVPKRSCISGCICKAGTLRDRSGKCVPEDKCPPITGSCAANEEFSKCVQTVCRAQLCSHKGHRVSCRYIPKDLCRSGCVCKVGMLRDRTGRCVPEENCPGYKTILKCAKNELLNECSNGCDPVSCPKSYADEQAWQQNCVAPAVCGPKECTCIDDYRRLNGKCIHIGQCPGICPLNEEYSNCTQASCRAQDCSQAGKPIACAVLAEGSCSAGCICKEGTLRDASGVCVPQNQCQPSQTPQCNQNQILSCENECPPEKTCRTRGIEYRCMEPTKPCEKKCICKPGYYKNPLGDCVSDEQCDQCKGDNEFFACDSACDNECSSIATQNRTNCPIKNIVCNPKCYCEDGFARDSTNQCVPAGKCPTKTTCEDPNEYYLECKESCPPEVCFAMSAFYDCSDSPPCEPGCACKPGYYRRHWNTTCIPSCECPQMYYADHCIRERFEMPKKPRKICADPNEEFVECKESCPPEVCFSILAFYDCSDSPLCEPGCACKPGHYRKEWNTTCVPSCECPQMYNEEHCEKSRNELNNTSDTTDTDKHKVLT